MTKYQSNYEVTVKVWVEVNADDDEDQQRYVEDAVEEGANNVDGYWGGDGDASITYSQVESTVTQYPEPASPYRDGYRAGRRDEKNNADLTVTARIAALEDENKALKRLIEVWESHDD